MTSRQKRLGSSLEKAIVKQAKEAGLEARLQPLSGMMKDLPNDAVVDDVLLECKVRAPLLSSSNEKSFRIDLGWLQKVSGNASKHGFRFGAVVFRLKGSQQKYVAMRYDDLLQLLRQMKES